MGISLAKTPFRVACAVLAIALLLVCGMALSPQEADAAKPKYNINVKSLTVDRASATKGDRVTYTVQISGGAKSAELVLTPYDGDERILGNGLECIQVVRLKRVGESNLYKGSFKVIEGYMPGVWKPDCVDIWESPTELTTKDVSPSLANKRAVRLIGITADSIEPTIAVSKISVSAKRVAQGSNVSLKYYTNDNLTGTQSLYFDYVDPSGNNAGIFYKCVKLGKEKGKTHTRIATATLESKYISKLGKYHLRSVTVSDAMGNSRTYLSKRCEGDYELESEFATDIVIANLSKGDFVVTDKYKIKFDANGGKGSMKCVQAKPGQSIVLPASSLKKSGYVFKGWNTKRDGTGTFYADGAKMKRKTAAGKTVTLYAQWAKKGTLTVSARK